MNWTPDDDYFSDDDILEERYLTFSIDDSAYGISIRFVTEIIGVSSITKVPETPDFIKGVSNLRGKIIPLVDVRLKFGKTKIPYTDRTCAVVAYSGTMAVGLIVDTVDDVMVIPGDAIARTERERGGFEARYLEGVATLDGKMIFLLDLERFLRADETDVGHLQIEGTDSY